MNKKDESILDEIFSEKQGSLIKRAIIQTEELSPNLKFSVLRIGKDVNFLLYGMDDNKNTQVTMLSEESFMKMKKLKIKRG